MVSQIMNYRGSNAITVVNWFKHRITSDLFYEILIFVGKICNLCGGPWDFYLCKCNGQRPYPRLQISDFWNLRLWCFCIQEAKCTGQPCKCNCKYDRKVYNYTICHVCYQNKIPHLNAYKCRECI